MKQKKENDSEFEILKSQYRNSIHLLNDKKYINNNLRRTINKMNKFKHLDKNIFELSFEEEKNTYINVLSKINKSLIKQLKNKK